MQRNHEKNDANLGQNNILRVQYFHPIISVDKSMQINSNGIGNNYCQGNKKECSTEDKSTSCHSVILIKMLV